MKLITPILLILLFLFFSGIGFAYGLYKMTNTAQAREYSPLDFAKGYQNFEVRVGIDKDKGRYYNYHYEF